MELEVAKAVQDAEARGLGPGTPKSHGFEIRHQRLVGWDTYDERLAGRMIQQKLCPYHNEL